MHEKLEQHLENALIEFSNEDNLQTLLKAKDEYFSLTGKTQEEDEDYESRMRTFNDWYILQYLENGEGDRIIEKYLSKNSAEEDVAESLKNVNHSLFEYTGLSLKKLHVLKDLLHDKKIVLAKGHSTPPLLKGDLFLGRELEYVGEHFLLTGLCTLPKDIKSILKKECKKLRKNPELMTEMSFLLKTESLRTRWLRYGHVDAKKIFDFSDAAK